MQPGHRGRVGPPRHDVRVLDREARLGAEHGEPVPDVQRLPVVALQVGDETVVAVQVRVLAVERGDLVDDEPPAVGERVRPHPQRRDRGREVGQQEPGVDDVRGPDRQRSGHVRPDERDAVRRLRPGEGQELRRPLDARRPACPEDLVQQPRRVPRPGTEVDGVVDRTLRPDPGQQVAAARREDVGEQREPLRRGRVVAEGVDVGQGPARGFVHAGHPPASTCASTIFTIIAAG